MSTATAQRQYAELDEYIDYQLQKTRQGIKITDIFTALCGVAVLVIGYLLVFVLLDHWAIEGGISYGWRVTLWSLVVLCSAGWFGWKVVLPYLRSVNRLFAARALEELTPELEHNLLNWVDLRRASHDVSPLVLRSIEKRAAVTLSRTEVEEAIDRRPLLHMLYGLLAVVAVFCGYAIFTPKKVGPSFWRGLLPTSDVQVATQTQILDVKPGTAEVLARTQLDITADLHGEVPSAVEVRYTTADRRFVDESLPLLPTDDGVKRYRGILTGEGGEGLLQDLAYYVVAGDARSREYHITVIQPPSAAVQDVTYEYPAYTKMERETRTGGNIDVLEGTQVTIRAVTNMPVKTSILQFSDDEKFSGKSEEHRVTVTDGEKLRVAWSAKPREDGSYPKLYRLQVKTESGHSDPAPTIQTVRVRPDLPPEVELVSPSADLEVPANAIIPLVVRARDPDFELRFLTLKLELADQTLDGKVLYEGTESETELTADWRIEDLGLKPGDELTYYVEARDNKAPVSNRKNTPKRKLTILPPTTPEKVQEQLAQEKQRIEEKRSAEQVDANDMPPGESASEDKPDRRQESSDPPPDNGDKQPQQSDDMNRDRGEEKSNGNADQNRSKTGEGSGNQSDGQAEKSDGSGQSSNGAQQKGSGEQSPDGNSSSRPLNNDGSDDRDVLQKLLERNRQRQQGAGSPPPNQNKPGDKNQSSDSSDSKSGTQQGTQDAPSTKPKSGNQSKSGDEKAADPGMDQEPRTSQDATESDTARKPQKSGDSQTGEKTQPGSQPADPSSKGSAAPKADKPQSPSDSNTQQKSTSKESPDRRTGDSAEQNATPKGDQNNDGGKNGGEPKSGAERTRGSDSNSTKTPMKEPQPKPSTGKQQDPAGDSATEPGSKKPQEKSEKPSQGDNSPSGDSKPSDPDGGKSDPPSKGAPGGKPQEDPKGGKSSSGDRSNQTAGENSSKTGDEKSQSESPDSKSPKDGQSAGQKSSQSTGSQSDSKDGAGGQSGEKNATEKPGDKGDAPDRPKDQGGDSKDDSQQADAQSGESSEQGGNKSSKSDQGGKSGNGKSAQGQGSQPGKTPGGKSEGGTPGSSQRSPAEHSGKIQPGSSPGEQDPNQAPQKGQGAQGGGDSGLPDAEAPSLEDKLKATNLVLDKLKEDLERGDVDDDFLKQLGWTQDDLKRFIDRLDRQLRSESETAAEQVRRRQFEEMLKSLDLRSTGSRRTDQNQSKRTTSDFTDKRAPVPLEYRDAVEEYSKKLARQKKSDSSRSRK